MNTGPAAGDCHFVVDTDKPKVPGIESEDFPDGETGLAARTTGTVTLTPAAEDTDVAEYVYGFQKTKMTMRIKAAADGRADVTAVLDHGFGRTMVWNVTARDGGFNTGVAGWDSGLGGGFALHRTRPVQGDFDGDGRTDLAMLREEAGRRVTLNVLTSDGNRYDLPAEPGSDRGATGERRRSRSPAHNRARTAR